LKGIEEYKNLCLRGPLLKTIFVAENNFWEIDKILLIFSFFGELGKEINLEFSAF